MTEPSIRPVRRILLALAALAAALSASPALAQQGSWPTAKPITLVVPYPPGGATDLLARAYGEKLQARLGQTVLIDNRAGANTLIASKYVIGQPADGYTLYVGSTAFSSGPVVQPQVFTYDIRKDFTPISLLALSPLIVVVNPSLPVKSVADLVALAKSRRTPLNVPTTGVGSNDHLALELFAHKIGVKMNIVPYKGAAPAMQDLVTGILDWRLDAIPSSKPFVDSGKLRAIAVGGARTNLLPDLPALSETVPGVSIEGYFGLLAPRGLPTAIVDRLNKETAEILAMPDLVARLRGMGLEPKSSTPQAWMTMAVQDADYWAKVVKDANIKVE